MLSTVLIIDKRKELSIKYKKSIDEVEINTIITRTLKDALITIQNLEPEMIIISDSIEEDLTKFCQKIRALTYNTRPIIIALSKSAETGDKIKVLENGADDFISEPVNIDEFKTRIKAHLRRDIETQLDNKTLLPNQNYVRKNLKRALSSENQAVLYIEFKNLETYKSVYTEVAKDKLIQTFIAICKSTMDENDFIGHYDDKSFVIVTNCYSAEKLANFLVFAFDTVVSKFYSEEDTKRGYMLLKGERFAEMRVNFVSILIGGIINKFNLIPSVDALIERLQAIKELAKIPAGSNYVIERTKLSGANSISEDVYNKNILIKEPDESLKFLLRTSLELQGYDVQEEFNLDSISQPAIIIIDSGEDLSELEFLAQAKSSKNFVNTKFIVTTTTHNKSDVLNKGADLYLPKPYEISDLIRWVEYFLNK